MRIGPTTLAIPGTGGGGVGGSRGVASSRLAGPGETPLRIGTKGGVVRPQPSWATGGTGLPLGPLGAYGSGGGVTGGGGSVGAGGGTTVPAQFGQMQTQQNPYIEQLMRLSSQLYQKPLDWESERSKMRAEQSQRLREAQQMAAGQGRGGLWGSQQQQLERGFGQDIAGAEAGFGNRQLQAQRDLLGTMTGIAGAGTQDIMGQLAAQQAVNQLNLTAQKYSQDYDIARQELPIRALAAQSAAYRDMLSLI